MAKSAKLDSRVLKVVKSVHLGQLNAVCEDKSQWCSSWIQAAPQICRTSTVEDFLTLVLYITSLKIKVYMNQGNWKFKRFKSQAFEKKYIKTVNVLVDFVCRQRVEYFFFTEWILIVRKK